MRKNVGLIDRIIRIIIGMAMSGFAIYFKNIIGIIALYPVATALIGWDPFYTLLNIDTDL